MIKINLLGEESAATADNTMWLAAYGASLVVAILAFVGLYFYMDVSITALSEKVEIADGQLARLKEKTKEVSDLERRKADLQNMAVAIATLKKSQEGPVKLLSDINSAMPDRLWLTSASMKTGLLRLEGIALSDDAIVVFTQNLKQSPFIDAVKLVDRITTPLAQINTYNSQTGAQSRIICRGEKELTNQRMSEVKLYAERMGLVFVSGMPPTVDRFSDTPDSGATQTVTKLSFESSGKSRLTAVRPEFFAWENVQRVQGESFIIESKMSYTPKSLNLDALTIKNPPPAAKPGAKS